MGVTTNDPGSLPPAPLYVLRGFGTWWPALLRWAETGDRRAHAGLGAALIDGAFADAVHAAAHDLLAGPNAVATALAKRAQGPADGDGAPSDPEDRAVDGQPNHGLRRALIRDLARLVDALRAADDAPAGAPTLRDLAPAPHGLVGRVADALRAAIADRESATANAGRQDPGRDGATPGPSEGPPDFVGPLLEELEPIWRERGAGPLSLHGAFRWEVGAGRLRPLPSTDAAEPLESLVGVDRQLRQLTANIEAFLAGRPALHTLLYGPRGSGKSTAVKALLPRYRETGLRLLELPPDDLAALPEAIAAVRDAPQRVVVFVDDLSFDVGDDTYRPLKSLLEGSLAAPPANVLAVATSNRRHLVAESHRDRPELGDEDVHRWDTQHERLALADRFGLAITFPSADQRRYLEIVRARAEAAGDVIDDDEALEREAIRFAEWGNGYSGRSAAQFLTQRRQRS